MKPLKVTSSKLHQDVPVATGPLGIVNESARVHIQEGYSPQSAQALIEVVEINGIHQLSLAGSGYSINASKSCV